MRIYLLFLASVTLLSAGKYGKVKITPDISYVLVYHKGSSVKVHRIQDVEHRLTGQYAKTFHPCPSECIQPVSLGDGVKTIGEIEVIHFMKHMSSGKNGLIVDTRTKELYNKETIPTAANIPYSLSTNLKALEKLFLSLGMQKRFGTSWDTSNAMDLIFYSNGLWCGQASQLIKSFVERGYPAEKIKYYRGGFQMWKILGFTTVVSKKGGEDDEK